MPETAAVTDWVTLSELAKRAGRRHRAAQKAIESGRIPPSAVRRSATGRIKAVDAVAALSVWGADDAAGGRQAQRVGGAAPDTDQRQGRPETPVRGPKPSHSGTHRRDEVAAGHYREKAAQDARRAGFVALNEELDYQERVGKLVKVEDVQREVFAQFRRVRDRAQNWANRLAPILAAESDPAKVGALMRSEIDKMLTELADEAVAGKGLTVQAESG